MNANESEFVKIIMQNVKPYFIPKWSQIENMRKAKCTKEKTEELKKTVKAKFGGKYSATIDGKR